VPTRPTACAAACGSTLKISDRTAGLLTCLRVVPPPACATAAPACTLQPARGGATPRRARGNHPTRVQLLEFKEQLPAVENENLTSSRHCAIDPGARMIDLSCSPDGGWAARASGPKGSISSPPDPARQLRVLFGQRARSRSHRVPRAGGATRRDPAAGRGDHPLADWSGSPPAAARAPLVRRSSSGREGPDPARVVVQGTWGDGEREDHLRFTESSDSPWEDAYAV